MVIFTGSLSYIENRALDAVLHKGDDGANTAGILQSYLWIDS
jgi:hypothetical protein